MDFDFQKTTQDHIMIVAHRGVAGGNIPCNTLPAYEIALSQGADMIETDVAMSANGTLYVFHPGMESSHLPRDTKSLSLLTDEEISHLRYLNYDRVPTQFPVYTFDEFLRRFKGRCYVNVDKFWDHPREIHNAIKKHGMSEQILVKSLPNENVFRVLEEVAPELQFMPLAKNTHPLHEDLMRRNINYVGVEVLFEDDNDEVGSEEFIAKMHSDGKLVWLNTIIYDCRRQIAAGHSDDAAMCGDPDGSWGWAARRGFDLIQTDWPATLISYLKTNGLYYRR